jgi:Fibronectin type III domain
MLRRILTIIAVSAVPLSLIAVSALPASADETAPTLSPAQGPPGTVVTASAPDWSGCSSMSVSGWGATLGTTSIDVSGAFSLSFTVPSDAALGATQLQFDPTCTHSTYIPFVTFTVTQGTAPSPPASAPAAPSDLTVTAVDPNDIRLNWQDNSSNETGFEINNGVISKTVGRNSTTYTWGGLAPDTYMCFRIRAYNSAGDSAWNPDVSPWYVCATTPTSKLFTWGDYLTYLQRFYHGLAGADLSLNCLRGSTGSFSDLAEGCLSLLWQDAPHVVRILLDTAFDALKCVAAAKDPAPGVIGACMSVSGAELVVLVIHAALKAVPGGQALLNQPFPVQP